MNELKPYYRDESEGGTRILPDSAIEQIENQLCYKLPDDYRNLIAHYGGIGGFSFSSYVAFLIMDERRQGERALLFVMFGVLPGDSYDLLEMFRGAEGRMPPELLPIGSDPGGNMICLALAGEHTGAVYFWAHHDEPMALSLMEPVPTDYSNVYLVANSFDEFMRSLKVYEEA